MFAEMYDLKNGQASQTIRCHNAKHNDTQYNDILNNENQDNTQHNDTKLNDSQHNYDLHYSIQQNNVHSKLCVNFIFYRAPLFYWYAKCHHAECHYAECHHAECRYVVCHCAQHLNVKCHGAKDEHVQNSCSKIKLIYT